MEKQEDRVVRTKELRFSYPARLSLFGVVLPRGNAKTKIATKPTVRTAAFTIAPDHSTANMNLSHLAAAFTARVVFLTGMNLVIRHT